MSSALHNVPDVTTFAANVVVFLGAVAAAVAGAMHAVKKIKESWVDATKNDKPAIGAVTSTQVIGGLLQDAMGSAMMAEQLRELNGNIERLCTTMTALAHEIELDRVTRNGR